VLTSVFERQDESDGCVRASGTTSNAFRWYGRGRLVEVEHVFDAQGGLHIVELLLGGSRKITSGTLDGVRKTSLCTSGAATEFEFELTSFNTLPPNISSSLYKWRQGHLVKTSKSLLPRY